MWLSSVTYFLFSDCPPFILTDILKSQVFMWIYHSVLQPLLLWSFSCACLGQRTQSKQNSRELTTWEVFSWWHRLFWSCCRFNGVAISMRGTAPLWLPCSVLEASFSYVSSSLRRTTQKNQYCLDIYWSEELLLRFALFNFSLAWTSLEVLYTTHLYFSKWLEEIVLLLAVLKCCLSSWPLWYVLLVPA